VITQSLYTIGNQGEALVVFLLPKRRKRFLWFCPERGFVLLPPPLHDFGSLIKLDDLVTFRFSTMTGGAWRSNLQNVAITIIYRTPNGSTSASSLCVPWEFNIPCARRWIAASTRSDAPLDLLLPLGQSFIIPHAINVRRDC
jgi:hypothetical protein